MSLLNTLPYSEYEKALKFSLKMCQDMAAIAKLKRDYTESRCPGEQLMFDLESVGYTLPRYRKLMQLYDSRLDTSVSSQPAKKPHSKLAIMVANQMYKHQYKLKTPLKDCEDIGERLKNLGFIVVILKDVTTEELNNCIVNIMSVLPEESYVLIYLAGHGAELSGVRYIICTEASRDRLTPSQMVSADFILSRVAARRPILCVLIMDVCAGSVEIDNIKCGDTPVEECQYKFEGSLIIAYSTSSNQPAYEQVEVECNTDSVSSIRYLDTARYALASAAASLYAEALKNNIQERTSVSKILQKVAEDLRRADRKQVPVTIESGSTKTYLFDDICGDHEKVHEDVKNVLENNEFNNFTILYK